MFSITFVAVIVIVVVVSPIHCMDTNRNIYGKQLKECSYEGAAITGHLKAGKCISRADSHPSKSICLDVGAINAANMEEEEVYMEQTTTTTTTISGQSQSYFCGILNQMDWCKRTFPCHENKDKKCPVKHYCVSQFDFAYFIELTTSACDSVTGYIDCEATNMEIFQTFMDTLTHIHRQEAMNRIHEAIACLEKQCNVSLKDVVSYAEQEL